MSVQDREEEGILVCAPMQGVQGREGKRELPFGPLE